MRTHPLRDNLFENLIVADLFKTKSNVNADPQLYFWRDSGGLEIDLIIDNAIQLRPVEIKSGETLNSSWFQNIQKWIQLADTNIESPTLCYAGNSMGTRSGIETYAWHEFCENPFLHENLTPFSSKTR